MKPLCFVLMPFGIKEDAKKRQIDFDAIYNNLIIPAIKSADMEAIRADEEMVGGIIHKPMYERLLMCDYAIADLTTANANVFYELGVRHAARPYSTLSIFSSDSTLPFDVQMLRAYPYSLDEKNSLNILENDIQNITTWLNEARQQNTDSPLYQFFDDLQPHILSHEKTDVFRKQVRYSNEAKKRLEKLRRDKDLNELRNFQNNLNLADTEGGVLIDLYLSYRALEAWPEMVELVNHFPRHLAQSLMVKEQLGLALNRAGKNEAAESVLIEALDVYGASSETYGILGRIYKDRWKNESNPILRESWLKKAIDIYIKGFETDWRDAYPGINAITLINTLDEPDARLEELVYVVRYAVKQRISQGAPDYWDFATLLELEVLAQKEENSKAALLLALPKADEAFMPKTTADTLIMIFNKWSLEKNKLTWLQSLIDTLMAKYETLRLKENLDSK